MSGQGAFITLEGTEGVGKSTCMDRVRRLLEAAGHAVVLTREPGGTGLGERVREWVLAGDGQKPSPDTEALLMFAARSQHLDYVIRPALARGQWVVCDRFTDATHAYQGGGGGVDDKLLASLERAVQRGLQPDLTLLFDAPVELGLERIAGRAHDRFEQHSVEFFERVRRRYLQLAEQHPERIRIIDASRPPDEVGTAVEQHLRAFLAARGEQGR